MSPSVEKNNNIQLIFFGFFKGISFHKEESCLEISPQFPLITYLIIIFYTSSLNDFNFLEYGL
jgi:hypothetical protein